MRMIILLIWWYVLSKKSAENNAVIYEGGKEFLVTGNMGCYNEPVNQK